LADINHNLSISNLLLTLAIKYHPNLQMGITCHSGRKGLWGGKIVRTGFRLCHSGLWTKLDVLVSGILQIWTVFRVFSDHRICKNY
ncbi:MAG TPA: hypothetical protein PLN14_07045, partial [Candidatus Hydrothermia bacterium]|nr:hypothetical protein [Candidatus Hydrothermia bacterium]HPO79525.1 hypothetical protein [Candidatus Hydrothermia bacterium]